MKKILLILLAIMLTALTACSSSEKTVSDKNTDTTKMEENNESIEVDKGLLNVEVTLPASMFEGEDIKSSIEEIEKDGIEAKKNDDGSVTYKMSKSKHKEMMNELEADIMKSLDDMKNGEDFASIQDIKHNNLFSEFTLIVDKAAYENSFDGFAVFGLGLSGMYYQLFKGVDSNNLKVKILVQDGATNEVFDEVVFPDTLEDMEAE